jgi:hypothetical protein
MADFRNDFDNSLDNFAVRVNNRNKAMMADFSWFLTPTQEKTGRDIRISWNDWGGLQKDRKLGGGDTSVALFGVSGPLVVQ